jgi:CRP/FNR family transcriptional regulator
MAGPLEFFPPFSVLPSPVQAGLRATAVLVRAAAGRVLFEEGADAGAIYIIAAGRLILQRRAVDGRAHTVCHLSCQGLACCLTALDHGPCPATAVAGRDSTLLRIPCPLFRELLETQPQFARATLGHIGRQLRQFACDGAPMGDAGARIASKIVSASTQFGPDVPLTRREIAEMAGTAVTTAIRETRRFEEAGWVSLGRGHVRVLDSEALCLRAKQQCAQARSNAPTGSADPGRASDRELDRSPQEVT